MDNWELRQIAQEKAKKKVEFRIHLITFIVIMTLLAIINLTLTPGYIWFKWPLLGWGIGIFLHGLKVYSSVKSMEERMIEKEMRKLNDESIENRR